MLNLKDRFYVSIGFKGRPRASFAMGSIAQVKEDLRQQGLTIVNNARQAQANIIPNGALPGSTNLPYFYYSSVIRALSEQTAEPEKKTTPTVSRETDATLIFDFPGLERELDQQFGTQEVTPTWDNFSFVPEIFTVIASLDTNVMESPLMDAVHYNAMRAEGDRLRPVFKQAQQDLKQVYQRLENIVEPLIVFEPTSLTQAWTQYRTWLQENSPLSLSRLQQQTRIFLELEEWIKVLGQKFEEAQVRGQRAYEIWLQDFQARIDDWDWEDAENYIYVNYNNVGVLERLLTLLKEEQGLREDNDTLPLPARVLMLYQKVEQPDLLPASFWQKFYNR